MTPMTGPIVLIVYGVLLIIGGFMGYRAGSTISLMAGGGLGLLAIVSAAITQYAAARPGLILGAIVSVLVLGAMTSRFMKTKAFMPAGFTALLSLGVLVLLVVIVLRTGRGV